jgi:hypothetical protein
MRYLGVAVGFACSAVSARAPGGRSRASAIRVTLPTPSSPSSAEAGASDALAGADASALDMLPPVVPVAAVNAAVEVPVGWLLDKGSDALRARVLLDLAPGAIPDSAEAARRVALAHAPALRLAVAQDRDGCWPGGLLAVPAADDPALEKAGTIPAVRRLLEYGWPADAPPFQTARRPLFRLLAEDADPSVLMELRDEATDEPRARAARRRVREAAGAAVAQMGSESDPRLRGLAVRTLERVAAWMRTVDKAERTAEGVPVLPSVLPEEAAPPSSHLLLMLGHMPRFRSEQTEVLNRLLVLLATPAPSGVPKQRVGTQAVPQPHLVLGDPVPQGLEPTGKALIPGLAWLEVLARLGAFRRSDRWRPVLDRLLDARDPDGRWTGRVSVPAPDAFVWPVAALGDPASAAARAADVTFRLALIARLAGHPLVLR